MTTHIKNPITERKNNYTTKKWKKMTNIIRHQIRKAKNVTKTASKVEINIGFHQVWKEETESDILLTYLFIYIFIFIPIICTF